VKFPSDLIPDINLWFDCFAELMKFFFFFFFQCCFSCVNLIALKKWSPFKTVTFENCYQGIFFSSVRNHAETHLSHLISQQAIALGMYPAFKSSLDVIKLKSIILFTCGRLIKWLSQLRIQQKSQHYINELQEKEPLVILYWSKLSICLCPITYKLHINMEAFQPVFRIYFRKFRK